MLGPILLALGAHVLYAGNDLTGAVGARKMSAAKMALFAWLFGLVVYLLLAPFFFHHTLYLKPVMATFVLAMLIAAAYPLFLMTVERGNATINGVICGIYPLWIVILSVIFFHETLSGRQIFALTIIFLGVILSSLHLTRKTRLRSLFSRWSLLALFVSLLWGVAFCFERYPIRAYGWFEASFMNQLFATMFSVIILVPIIVRSRKGFKLGKSAIWPAANAAAGATGGMMGSAALAVVNNSIVGPITGSYPWLYAVGSYLIFREKLTKLQITGVVLTVVGVALLSFFSV